ncbi:protein translocase subunit SecF [Dehalococcoidia bacterium]|nr:protein translocase subunit SecF [Dehalococcoidia bacterium]
MFDFVGKGPRFSLLSLVVIISGMGLLAVLGFPLGIDFTGGAMMTVEFDRPVTLTDLRQELAGLGHHDVAIHSIEGIEGEAGFLIRTRELAEGEKQEIMRAFEGLGLTGKPSYEFISGEIARERARGAAIAVVIGAIGILIYISWAFRKLPNPFRYGTCAIIALVHDILIVMAVFAILGGVLHLEINLMFITAILAVIGYSVNDTIVVFDRIRENLGKGARQSFETVVNNSLMESLSRSLNTSLTTLIVLAAIYLIVGEAIRSFIVVLMVGVVSGTYSSIFIAAQALVAWETGKVGKIVRRAA